jgi:predicted acylesterase/phospholipase RssA
MRFGLALGGGGARRAAHIGVLNNTPELLLRPEVDTIG